MDVSLVGVDCATDEARMGLAHGLLLADGRLRIARATLGTAGESAMATVASWITPAERYIVAFDAPLGWPAALCQHLQHHHAGEVIRLSASALLRRRTEQVVADQYGKLPPEVGADRVARTALSALLSLSQLRAITRQPVPLVWHHERESGVIEVHPPSTLRAHGIKVDGYRGKSPKARAGRREVIKWLQATADFKISPDLLLEDAHLLDAVLSVLAAADFTRGECAQPEDPELARKEGWIWVRGDAQYSLF